MHRVAGALRKAGKPIWPKSIDIRSIVREDQANTSAAHISAIAIRIGKLLRKQAPSKFFDVTDPDYSFDFEDAVDAMESCTVAALTLDEENGCTPVEMLNEWLTVIYDWGDVNRIWLGRP